MKRIHTLISALLIGAVCTASVAQDLDGLKLGAAEVVSTFETRQSGMSILTLVALVPETNNSLRGLKNTDRRRLGKLGQLVYQCKLMLYQPGKAVSKGGGKDPILVSKNYSLFTGVDVRLSADERVGIRVQALQSVDDDSLFTASLGRRDTQKQVWETLDEGAAVNLKQFDVNLLKESDLVETSASIDIVVRFPVFQMEKPVYEWTYNFALDDFRRAVRHVDDHCTPARLRELIDRSS